MEALLGSLRGHLNRLTDELSSHQELLLEIKTLRDSDAQNLREKSIEIGNLRTEVERLGGEVQVLRGVVEEGLRERRAARATPEQQMNALPEQRDEDLSEEEDHEEGAPMDPQPIPGSSRREEQIADKTMRTDYATVGSRQSPHRRDLPRIATEMDERRTEISSGSVGSQSHLQSYFNSGEHEREEGDVDDVLESVLDAGRWPPVDERRPNPPRDEEQQESYMLGRGSPPPRPPAPTPGRFAGKQKQYHEHSEEATERVMEPPAPDIRGARVQRLFFAAEHDARTCSMCQRRKTSPLSPAWLPSRLGRRTPTTAISDDEGFVDGPDAGPGRHTRQPQTVLAKVVVDMEAEFAHFKR